tara:strand:- start:5978 stop:6193 length:216 start_codon:yes stop_codon:yes gene_type:complete
MSPAFLEAFWHAGQQRHHKSVLGITYVHSVLAGRLFTRVSLGKRPEQRVGKSVLAEVGEHLILDLESRELS